jgi:Tfp pilus assembly protein PilP
MGNAIPRPFSAGLVLALWFTGIGVSHAVLPDAGDATAMLAARDPFEAPNVQPPPPEPRKSPLETYDLHALTLVAVIWDSATPRAMVEDSGGLGYTIGVGTPIGTSHGVVRTIEPDRVVVEESYKDFFGDEKTDVAVLKLRSEGKKTP